MNSFLKYFYQDMGIIWGNFVSIMTSIIKFISSIFNIEVRKQILQTYSSDFGTLDWAMCIGTHVIAIVCVVLLLLFGGRFFRRIFRFRVPVKENEQLKAEVAKLTREVFKLNYEKDKILAMKVAELGMSPQDEFANIEQEAEDAADEALEDFVAGARNTVDSAPVNPDASRFFRLTAVDNFYKTEYKAPEYDNEINLEEFCNRYRNFAASRLKLFYDIDILRFFVASLGASRMIILQGISGTGKTSLPYSFGKYLMLDSTIAAVQPAWRERTELFGYFNEFTKKFNETEFLRAVYEANYFQDPHVIVLDEMNIARVEYYFAEMLSVLEMPRPEEWLVDIVTNMWDNDPCLINGGKIHVNDNTWFVGTINNDDSTFAVADKVYDRAIPIDLDSKAPFFIAEDAEPIHVTAAHLTNLFTEAKGMYPITPEMLKKLDELDVYVIKHFRIAFGNRIMKQIKDFIPCYVACGGTEIDGIDFMVAKKILRKFESLNLGFLKDELHKFVLYLDRAYGKQNMKICKEYLIRMQKQS